MDTKKIVLGLILIVFLFISGTILVSALKPQMHGTFNIEKLIIKKEVKR